MRRTRFFAMPLGGLLLEATDDYHDVHGWSG